MTSEFDELDKEIMGEMRQIYTETVIDHAMNPRNAGTMENADGFARITDPCGDTMGTWLRVRNDNIIEAFFLTDERQLSFAH